MNFLHISRPTLYLGFGLTFFGLLFLESAVANVSEGHKEETRRLIDISASPCCRAINLEDQHGQAVSLDDFSGKAVIVVFGFTHCPNVCPTTLFEISSGLAEKSYKDEVALLFVTLDPERDHAEMLAQYVTVFPPSIALRGTDQDTNATAAEFRVLYRKVYGDDGQYTLEHTDGTYVIDKSGAPAWYVPFGGINTHFWAALDDVVAIQ